MTPKARPNLAALIFGIFLGWSGGVRWIERLGWVGVLILIKAHPWNAQWTTHWDLNITCVIIAVGCFVSGALCGHSSE